MFTGLVVFIVGMNIWHALCVIAGRLRAIAELAEWDLRSRKWAAADAFSAKHPDGA